MVCGKNVNIHQGGARGASGGLREQMGIIFALRPWGRSHLEVWGMSPWGTYPVFGEGRKRAWPTLYPLHGCETLEYSSPREESKPF